MKKYDSGIIRTQEDLDKVMSEEDGMYYITLNGLIATFGNKMRFNLLKANEKLEEIALGSSEAVSEAMVEGRKKEAKEFIDVMTQTFMVPFRYH